MSVKHSAYIFFGEYVKGNIDNLPQQYEKLGKISYKLEDVES